MAVVLVATGLFLYVSLRSELDHAIAQGLRSRAGDISALVRQSDTGLKDAARAGSVQAGAGFAQILDRSGRIFDATPGVPRHALLSSADIRAAQAGQGTFERARVSSTLGHARLLATPVHAQGRSLVVVVGASLKDRDQAVANLGARLLIGGPAALLLAALGGYGLATAALRPVESMRARAAAISPDDLDQRLPLSPSRDELHRLGATLNAMLGRLEAGQARERSFVADASHELRTPLTMLKTELELIGRERPAGEQLEGAVASAIDEADRLATLTQDLLVLARSDADRLPATVETVRVSGLLAAVGRRYAGVEVGGGLDPPDLEVRVEPARIERALANMVDNALRHGAMPVRVAARAVDGCVELHVTDAGPGFPAEFVPRAFERFARAEAGRTTTGAGLGLAIVEAIAVAHGGSAHVANRAGGGADIWIAIPRRPVGD